MDAATAWTRFITGYTGSDHALTLGRRLARAEGITSLNLNVLFLL
jgi:hypothetical protein